MPDLNTCSIDGCEKSARKRGWCEAHYYHWQVNGDPLGGKRRYSDPREAFAARTSKTPGCWMWQRNTTSRGYGALMIAGKNNMAHRYSYETSVGPIPEGMQVDHICPVRLCVNPAHLRLVSPKQNMEHRKGANRNNISGELGVHKAGRGWCVKVTHNREAHYGGYFKDIDEAKDAARALRNHLFTHNDRDRAA